MSYTNLIRPGNHDYWTSEASLSSKANLNFMLATRLSNWQTVCR